VRLVENGSLVGMGYRRLDDLVGSA
jgi:hypothetical protein